MRSTGERPVCTGLGVLWGLEAGIGGIVVLVLYLPFIRVLSI